MILTKAKITAIEFRIKLNKLSCCRIRGYGAKAIYNVLNILPRHVMFVNENFSNNEKYLCE
jgi:hypothetical protein